METIDKIIITLFVLVIIGYIIRYNVNYSKNNKKWSKRKQSMKSQAIITSNQPIVIQPLKQKTSQQIPITSKQISSNPTIQGVSEKNIFRKNLQAKKTQLKYDSVKKEGFENTFPVDNEMISNANYAKFKSSEDLNLNETEIEEKNVFNNLFN